MFEVLQSKRAIEESRETLRRQGRSAVRRSGWARLGRRLGLPFGLPVGDFIKSWDVAKTLEFIAQRLPESARIVDLGAYCSELPVSLVQMGYSGVHGVDLNPNVKSMPYSDRAKYIVSDFMRTPLESGTFDAMTAISVIEHGYDPERLFAEAARLLRPGGYFIASFDYWPEKIDTGNTTFFDMSWLIFSSSDVQSMLAVAAKHGLRPVGSLNPGASEKAIQCQGYDYTFGWIALEKAA